MPRTNQVAFDVMDCEKSWSSPILTSTKLTRAGFNEAFASSANLVMLGIRARSKRPH